ncbi:MAG TPA: carboxypeptidase-like regulatory domain-containing protein [Terracidiphilus sp.]|nr:carboxypeptidase-like regulatory domain-containing protein [Terracidiphilus sp.]
MNLGRARLPALAALVLGILYVSSCSAISGFVAQAQNLGERTVTGTVLDGASNPVQEATVFLKNQKTKTIRSFTSLANGHFYFAQVNKAEDFDLWAEKDGKKSEVKTVSSWDDRSQFVTDLRLK